MVLVSVFIAIDRPSNEGGVNIPCVIWFIIALFALSCLSHCTCHMSYTPACTLLLLARRAAFGSRLCTKALLKCVPKDPRLRADVVRPWPLFPP